MYTRLKEYFPGLDLIIVIVSGIILFYGSVISNNWIVNDFCQNHTASQRFLSGQPIYSPLSCNFPKLDFINQYPAHPPFSILFFLPLTLFDLATATWIWFAISVCAYFICLIVLLKITRFYNPLVLFLFCLGSLFWRAYFISHGVKNFGQFFLLILVLIIYSYRRNKPFLIGTLVALIALIKIWPAVFGLIFLIIRKFKIAFSALLVYLLGTIFTLLLVNPKEIITYLTVIIPNERVYYSFPENISIAGFIVRLFSGDRKMSLPPLLPYFPLEVTALWANLISLFFLLIYLYLVHYYHQKSTGTLSEYLLFIMTPLALQLFFPLTWDWNIIFLLVPAVLLAEKIRDYGIPSKLWLGLVGVFSLGVIFPGWYYPIIIFKYPANHPELITLTPSWITLCCLSLLVLLFYYANYLIKSASKYPPHFLQKPV